VPRPDSDSALARARVWPPGGPALAAGGRAATLVAVVSSETEADAAVRAGADLVDLAAATQQQIIAVRDRHPDVGVCTADVAAARAAGVIAICPGIVAAQASGLPAARLLVEVPLGLVRQAGEEGWAAVVDADQAAARAQNRDPGASDDVAGDAGSAVLAIAAIASWLGAAAVRTRHPGPVRRALDMTASIRGLRPPARAVRGLA
jgi:hypothetical protein